MIASCHTWFHCDPILHKLIQYIPLIVTVPVAAVVGTTRRDVVPFRIRAARSTFPIVNKRGKKQQTKPNYDQNHKKMKNQQKQNSTFINWYNQKYSL